MKGQMVCGGIPLTEILLYIMLFSLLISDNVGNCCKVACVLYILLLLIYQMFDYNKYKKEMMSLFKRGNGNEQSK